MTFRPPLHLRITVDSGSPLAAATSYPCLRLPVDSTTETTLASTCCCLKHRSILRREGHRLAPYMRHSISKVKILSAPRLLFPSSLLAGDLLTELKITTQSLHGVERYRLEPSRPATIGNMPPSSP